MGLLVFILNATLVFVFRGLAVVVTRSVHFTPLFHLEGCFGRCMDGGEYTTALGLIAFTWRFTSHQIATRCRFRQAHE